MQKLNINLFFKVFTASIYFLVLILMYPLEFALPAPSQKGKVSPSDSKQTAPELNEVKPEVKPGINKNLLNPKLIPRVPKLNKAIYLGWKGQIETQLKFSEFFDNDHTIMAWFMPQYPYGYEGPIFSVNGTGDYLVGQGNYRSLNKSIEDPPGSGKKIYTPRVPVLYIKIGTKDVRYLMPQFQKDRWVHIAIIRKNNLFKLYLNGKPVGPVKRDATSGKIVSDTEIVQPANFISKPSGTLRFGRFESTSISASPNWQAYGLLDDSAVFKRALSVQELTTIINNKRLGGWENDLIAGWSFDKPGPDEMPLPPLLNSWSNNNNRAYHVPVSEDRNSNKDSKQFDNPYIIGESAVELKLPFKVDEVWKVIQGYDDSKVSHNGKPAFCWDFILANYPQTGEYPKGTRYAPIYNAASGKLFEYRQTGSFSGDREPYVIIIKTDEKVYHSYLHLHENSFTTEIKGGTYRPSKQRYRLSESDAPYIQRSKFLAELGPKAAHLHFGATSGGYTHPVAFSNYWVSNDGGKNWVKVFRGIPKHGQLIKRSN